MSGLERIEGGTCVCQTFRLYIIWIYLHKELKLSFHTDIHPCVDLNDDITMMTITMMFFLCF